MNRIICAFLLVVLIPLMGIAGDNVLEKLKEIPAIHDIQKLEVAPFGEYYQFWFQQPVDHRDPSRGTFRQKVLLGHRSAKAPVVAELEGYSVHSRNAGELSELLRANQLVVEHRFFDQSVPEGSIPWDYLTIRQAADDHHAVIKAIREKIYPDSKWITTGISKGGQVTIFHRYFYPDDVEISVPYVAPLNLEYVDPRLEKFLDRLGTAKNKPKSSLFAWEDMNSCRYEIRGFQEYCFENLDMLLPHLEKMAQEKGHTYQKVGGVRRALQLMILEYPFAFWQWGRDCAEISEQGNASWEDVFHYLAKISSPDFFEDSSIVKMQPFFYSALTEIGMYDYKVKPFKKYLGDIGDIDFSFAMPEGAARKPFDEKQMKAISKWLQTDAKKILFVYGGNDPWYATSVDLKDNWNCRKYVRGDMHHGCRIKDFDPVSREDLISTLKEWLQETN